MIAAARRRILAQLDTIRPGYSVILELTTADATALRDELGRSAAARSENARRAATLRERPKRLTPQQQRRAADDRAYARLREAFLIANPTCQICGQEATDVHHKRGRGALYLVVEHFAAVCRTCHDRAHHERLWGEQVGLMESRLAKREGAA